MQRHVLVIGSGQADLAAGYYLQRAGVPFIIVDASRRVGDSWRTRYDSLTLFTPRQFSSLPGLDLAGNRETYPDRDEFADYLEAYAGRFATPLRLGRRVEQLTRTEGELFEVVLDNDERIRATEAIVATGAFQRALVPKIARQFTGDVLQLTAETYRNPNQLPDGDVLVVGDGATGRDIAVECRKVQPVVLATGKPRKLLSGTSPWKIDLVVAGRCRSAEGFTPFIDRLKFEAARRFPGQRPEHREPKEARHKDCAPSVSGIGQPSNLPRWEFRSHSHCSLGGGV